MANVGQASSRRKSKARGAGFAKHFVTGDVLTPLLNVWFQNGVFPDEIPLTLHPNKEKDGAFHPSSALMCEKALYAKMRGELPPETTRAEDEKTWMFGRYAHELIQWVVVDQLKLATWEDVEKEYNLRYGTAAGNEVWIRGFSDIARANVPGHDEPVLVDIKSMASRLYSLGTLPGTKDAEYRAQVSLYLELEDLDTGIIICVEKDNPHRMREVRVERDGELVDSILEKWEYVADALAAEEIPDCTCGDKKCPAADVYH